MGSVAPEAPVAPASTPEDRFAAFFRLHEKGLRGFALRRTGSAEEADEVVAGVMRVAWRRFDDIPEGSPFGWLCGVALRVVLNESRGRRRRAALRQRLEVEVPVRTDADGLEAGSLLHEQFELVRIALASLSDEDQELIRLATWDHLGSGDIAAALDLSPAAARKRLSRARRRFRDRYEQLAADAERGGAPG